MPLLAAGCTQMVGAICLLAVVLSVKAQDNKRRRHQARRLLGIDSPLLSSLEIVLSSKRTVLLDWDYTESSYSLTVPYESVAAAVVATVANSSNVELVLFKPDERSFEELISGQPSAFADIPTEEATKFILEVRYGMRASNYTIAVLRSTITSRFDFKFPDPASLAPPEGTLTGLGVFDQYGVSARFDAFEPRRSQYIASVDVEIKYVWVIASQNDPEGRMQMRVDGQKYAPLPPGVNSPIIPVTDRGWTLLEISVESDVAMAAGFSPVLYEIVVVRDALCHERCRTCFGPGKGDCLSCKAPLVLFDGSCENTGCPPDTYYDWKGFKCRRCHNSCAQCTGPEPQQCTFCQALHFLVPTAQTSASGECTLGCPPGYFAHPNSRRCKAFSGGSSKTFYLSFKFRAEPWEYQSNPRMQQMVLNTTAFVLGVSLSDVKAFKLHLDNFGVEAFVEIVTPFLSKASAEDISIDMWFGAFELPCDLVTAHTWAQMHPPVPPLPVDAMIPMWGVGFLVSGLIGLLTILPLYCCYFRRLANTKKVYVIRRAVDPIFVDQMVTTAPAWIIKKFVALESGQGKAGQQ